MQCQRRRLSISQPLISPSFKTNILHSHSGLRTYRHYESYSPKNDDEGKIVESIPPPDWPPPRPPAFLYLPLVPQLPSAFLFSAEPARALFTTVGGVSRHLLINHSSDRLAIKICCSNNHYFRVNSVFSFIEPSAVAELEIIRLHGGSRCKDVLKIIYSLCRDTDNDAPLMFGTEAKTRAIMIAITTA